MVYVEMYAIGLEVEFVCQERPYVGLGLDQIHSSTDVLLTRRLHTQEAKEARAKMESTTTSAMR
jgi:hypothetical protein